MKSNYTSNQTAPNSTAFLYRTTNTALKLCITPFDLHVLGTPPAFVLSQDQTLEKIFEMISSF